MRKNEKEQIKQIVELLKQITLNIVQKGSIECALMKKNEVEYIENLLLVLQECQEAAITIGTCIEKLEKDSVESIKILEKYCETLYQFSIEMSDEHATKMQDALQEVENTIEYIPEKSLVCFLPYKASMWDSLESVWKVADEDANCDTYVIPIPYFDRNPDGTLGEFHYEGELYPSYVPITSYEKFDLEEIKPDKIFIHNPYDEYNRVTSVHPAFYSSKLMNYTEELVYIPYFVLNEIESDDELAVEHMAHFCKVPGVLNAHKVIVQSEKMKQVYVKVLTEWMGEDTRSKWEQKILGIGSPKLDKVTTIQKEDIEIPEDWLEIIQKPDGSWKKIVFYNTSVAAFLEHGEEMLEKIENVFGVFRECQDEIALLWRPHPLMVTTIKSMRPELLKKYQRIVKEYREKRIGIYDDTSDLNRAIALADAYFGDASSVVQLCQKAGMPVMIQDVKINYE